MSTRFSLLSLIGIVTVTGFLISLFSTYNEIRQTNARLTAVSAEIKADQYSANHCRTTCFELEPYVAKAEKTIAAREEMIRRTEVILEELIPEQSKVVPVDGKISIRRIPAIRRIGDYRSGYAIFVPDSCKCEIKLLFKPGEDELFEGFQSGSTFPPLSGLNEVKFRSIAGDGSTQMKLTINGDVVAKAVAEGYESNGQSYSNQVFDPQKDYSVKRPKRVPKLLEYSPDFPRSRPYSPEQSQPSVELHLGLVEVNSNE